MDSDGGRRLMGVECLMNDRVLDEYIMSVLVCAGNGGWDGEVSRLSVGCRGSAWGAEAPCSELTPKQQFGRYLYSGVSQCFGFFAQNCSHNPNLTLTWRNRFWTCYNPRFKGHSGSRLRGTSQCNAQQ